jgi:ElaB/YqjD/DUF883 family membrane-anchored ribosome-binding protein
MTETQVTREKLAKDLNQIASDSEQMLESAARAGNEKAQALRHGIEQNLRAARERLAQMQEDAMRTGQEAARATDEYVHSHPWQSIAAAVGVGAIVGLAMGVMLQRRR